MVYTKRAILMAALILTSVVSYADVTLCDGKWKNGQPVHIKIDWDNSVIKINDSTVFAIEGTNIANDGICTKTFVNSFGHEIYYVISHSKNEPIKLAVVDSNLYELANDKVDRKEYSSANVTFNSFPQITLTCNNFDYNFTKRLVS